MRPRGGGACSASSFRKASATRSRKLEPRLTAAILARFIRPSGRPNVVRRNTVMYFSACILVRLGPRVNQQPEYC